VNKAGEIFYFHEFSTQIEPDSPQVFIDTLLAEIHHILRQARRPVIGIGITFLGWINEARTGPYFCMNAPALHNFNFKALIEDEFDCPVVVHDDVTAHTLAEFTFGVGRGCRRFMCLAMGTGLGAGMIVDGTPLQFTGGCAGDTGHILLRPGGPECTAGCKGCAEALIGVAGIERLAREKYHAPKNTFEIIQGSSTGSDPVAISVMRDIGEYTGELLASLFPIFVPDRIALTGGTTKAGEALLESTREKFESLMGGYCRSYAHISGNHFSKDKIVFGELKGETGVIGAVVDLISQN
jgi:glucokinase